MIALALQAIVALASLSEVQDPVCPQPCIIVFLTDKDWCREGKPYLDCANWPYCNNCSDDCTKVSEPIPGTTDPTAGTCVYPTPYTYSCGPHSTYNFRRCSSLCYCTGVTLVANVPCESRLITEMTLCDIH